jgi:hypothetical protein
MTQPHSKPLLFYPKYGYTAPIPSVRLLALNLNNRNYPHGTNLFFTCLCFIPSTVFLFVNLFV